MTQIEEASDFGPDAAKHLHESDQVGASWVDELTMVIGAILHEGQPLPDVLFDLEVHQDTAGKPDEQRSHMVRHRDSPSVGKDD